MTKILITKATGFVGRALFENLKFKKKCLAYLIKRTNQEKLFKGGKTSEVNRLIGPLRINSSHAHKILEWNSPFSLNEKLKKTVIWYLHSR
jgi:nucleoside-diphosphate-sugar epimerase